MTKATHNGTCQCCGNTYAVNAKTGRIAKHGYRVMWNQEVGQCPGAYELPLEVDCSIAKRLLADLHKAEAEYVALGGEDPRTAQKVHVGYWQEADVRSTSVPHCCSWRHARASSGCRRSSTTGRLVSSSSV